jgi:hypothetical protein
MRRLYYLIALNIITLAALSQSKMYEITNCDNERRTVLYNQQLSNIVWCLKGDVRFKESIILKFSSKSNISLDTLEQRAARFRTVLPKNYWSDGVGVTRVDYIPNEEGRIWFEKVYVVEDKKGNIRPFAACKVVFEGTDPEKERVDPKIQDIEITFDEKSLKEKVKLIKRLTIVTKNTAPPVPLKTPDNIKRTERPPQVEKIEKQ